MNITSTKRSQLILLALVVLEGLDLCFPAILPASFVNIMLLIGIISLILCRLETLDHAVKQKHWR